MSIEAMKMALAKLEHLWEIGIDAEYKVELLPEIEALRQALAQPEQEPEAWMGITDNPYCDDADCNDPNGQAMRWHKKLLYLRKQEYTAPSSKPWVGLTDDEIHEAAIKCVKSGQSINAAIRAIEDKLKEKNNG